LDNFVHSDKGPIWTDILHTRMLRRPKSWIDEDGRHWFYFALRALHPHTPVSDNRVWTKLHYKNDARQEVWQVLHPMTCFQGFHMTRPALVTCL
jgi:hypothetical protein